VGAMRRLCYSPLLTVAVGRCWPNAVAVVQAHDRDNLRNPARAYGGVAEPTRQPDPQSLCSIQRHLSPGLMNCAAAAFGGDHGGRGYRTHGR